MPACAGREKFCLEHLVPIGDLEAERENDLPLGVEAALFPALDAINRESADPGPAGELGFGQQALFSEHLNVVR